MCGVYFYETEQGENPVQEFLRALEKDHQRRIRAAVELLALEGLRLRRPNSDAVRGAILLHGFVKKTDEIPESEINRAQGRMDDYRSRYRVGRIKL